jgi:hypothetical protein
MYTVFLIEELYVTTEKEEKTWKILLRNTVWVLDEGRVAERVHGLYGGGGARMTESV